MYIVKRTFMGYIVFNTRTGLMHSGWGANRVRAEEVKRILNARQALVKHCLRNKSYFNVKKVA